MSNEDFSLAFHIGAHKTATSHLQQSMQKASDALNALGVRYYGPEHFRLPGRTISALFGLRPREGAGRIKRTPKEQLLLMRKGADRVIFSEENFIGTLANPRRTKVEVYYPRAEEKIARLSQAVDQPIDVFLSIRNPVALLNSVYSQQLLGKKIYALDEFHALNPIQSVDWFDLVRRLRDRPEVNALTVWAYEDYNDLFPQVCSALAGVDVGRHVVPIKRRINQRLSAEAVAHTLALYQSGERGRLAQAAREAFPVGDAYPRFDGYSADQHAQAAEQYKVQIAQIAALDRVTLLTSACE
ncbi:hypothetical protein [Loktanella sp. S4079]|uniref:hypothetical protein n=1 Tax=Loktanella sp. S4079 TaxID=579483 RepID=UPI0005FA157E|nr:hypothetical protein [Loktanella sp. S4079]KJZ18151.1 hypothetical protein TW80_15665 [Loktanella sp. S4079]